MREAFYFTHKQRTKLLQDGNINNEICIFDDFLPDGLKRLTFDILDNTPDPIFLRTKQLLLKIQNDTITFNELKELLRIERNLQIQQTNRDVIITKFQSEGVTLRQRVKNTFKSTLDRITNP